MKICFVLKRTDVLPAEDLLVMKFRETRFWKGFNKFDEVMLNKVWGNNL